MVKEASGIDNDLQEKKVHIPHASLELIPERKGRHPSLSPCWIKCCVDWNGQGRLLLDRSSFPGHGSKSMGQSGTGVSLDYWLGLRLLTPLTVNVRGIPQGD
jgi:hypothetical protein